MSEKNPLFTRQWKSLWQKICPYLKIGLYALIPICIYLIFYYKIIIIGNWQIAENQTILNIYVTFNAAESSLIYSLLNGLLLGAFVAILVNVSTMNRYVKIIVVVFVLIFALIGIAVGIGVQIFLPLFHPQVFESNTVKGIDFLIGNLAILTLIFFASLITESEVKN